MSDKREYIQEVEEELEGWHDDIYKFRVIAEEVGWEKPDQQIEYYQIIEDIVAQKEEITGKISELKDLDQKNWQESKNAIDTLRKEIAKAIVIAKETVT